MSANARIPELDENGRFTADGVIDQIGEIAAEAAPPPLDLSGGQDGAVQIGGPYSQSPELAPGAHAREDMAIAIGATASAGFNATAIGGSADGEAAISLGGDVNGHWAIAMGYGSVASAAAATSIGANAEASGGGSVAIGRRAVAENDGDFVLGASDHNVKVPGTLSIQAPSEPQHAATKEYADYVAAGGVAWVAGITLTTPATLSEEDYVKLWLANPGGISLIQVAVELPAGSAGEKYEFTMNQDDLSPREAQALNHLEGLGGYLLPGMDNVSKEVKPVLLSTNRGDATLTPLLDHGGIAMSGTIQIPSFGLRGEGAEEESPSTAPS